MQIVAAKNVTEFSERNIETMETVFIVNPCETVEELIARMGIDGESMWHYTEFQVVLKLVKS
jgi:hypothetical protein